MAKRASKRASTHRGVERRGREAVLSSAVGAMRRRLLEAATRIEAAAEALERGDGSRAMEHLFELEPLVFDTERVLSALFLLAREAAGPTSVERGRSS